MASRSGSKSSSRVFVALDPPAEVCAEVAAWGRQVAATDRRMRPVPPSNCHITLAFIGEAAPAGVAAIGEAIEECSGPVGALSLGAPVWLPRRRPRALALDVRDGSGELEALHRRLAAALEHAIGWKPEKRFRPHLTAVRLGRGFDPVSKALPVSPAIGFAGAGVTLYRSTLLPEGARYEPLAGVDL